MTASSPTAPRVAVVYDVNSVTPMDLAQAASGVCRIVWVVDGRDPGLAGLMPLLRRLGDVLDTSGTEPEETAASLERHRPSGILTLAEAQMPLAAALAQRLALTYHSPPTAARLADKHAQRDALRTAGVAAPATWLWPELDAPSAADAGFADVRYPVVVKPRRGTNSIATARAGSPAQLRELLAEVGDVTGGMLIEEYLHDSGDAGPYADDLAVELLVQHRRITRLATTGKFRLAPPFRGRGCFLPSHLPAPDADEAYAVAESAIKALGISDGFANVDIKMTPGGPRVVEVNGRIGGNVPELIELAGGPAVLPLVFRLALGEDLADDPAIRGVRDAAWQRVGYFAWVQAPVDAGKLTGVRGLGEVAKLPHVSSVTLNRSLGANLDWTIGAQSHVCAVYGTVTSHADLPTARDEIDKLIELDYEPRE